MEAWKSRLTLAIHQCPDHRRRVHHRQVSIRVVQCVIVFRRYPLCRHQWSIILLTIRPQLVVRHRCHRWLRVPTQRTQNLSTTMSLWMLIVLMMWVVAYQAKRTTIMMAQVRRPLSDLMPNNVTYDRHSNIHIIIYHNHRHHQHHQHLQQLETGSWMRIRSRRYHEALRQMTLRRPIRSFRRPKF